MYSRGTFKRSFTTSPVTRWRWRRGISRVLLSLTTKPLVMTIRRKSAASTVRHWLKCEFAGESLSPGRKANVVGVAAVVAMESFSELSQLLVESPAD